MGADRESGRDGLGDDAIPDLYGPEDEWEPDPLDLAWYIRNVVSLGYPPVRRGERQMNGQSSIYDLLTEPEPACPHTTSEHDPCWRCEAFDAMDPNR